MEWNRTTSLWRGGEREGRREGGTEGRREEGREGEREGGRKGEGERGGRERERGSNNNGKNIYVIEVMYK